MKSILWVINIAMKNLNGQDFLYYTAPIDITCQKQIC